MKTNEFEFIETVNALTQVIGLSIASDTPEARAAFIEKITKLIASAEPHSIRWNLYRQVLREVVGELEDSQGTF